MEAMKSNGSMLELCREHRMAFVLSAAVEKPNYSEKNLFRNLFIQHESHIHSQKSNSGRLVGNQVHSQLVSACST
jgi:hypothetical protein